LFDNLPSLQLIGQDVSLKKKNWNERYQQLLEAKESFHKHHHLAQLAFDFNYTATVYGGYCYIHIVIDIRFEPQVL